MNLHVAARAVLADPDPDSKVQGALNLWRSWENGELVVADAGPPLDTPGRPQRPALLPPKDMPRRQLSGRDNHAALIHALAHIEFNAINMVYNEC